MEEIVVTSSPEPGPAPEGLEGSEAQVPLAALVESRLNPRRSFDPDALQELAESIRSHGVLQPLLVRPLPAKGKGRGSDVAGRLEIVIGARRFRAAKLAGLDSVPVRIRTLTDQDVLDVQLVENLQRTDLHPLEEAEGYRQLMERKYDVARIAERIGRSVKYVYDRVKLLSLTKQAQKVFLDDRITAGHAILLARLKPSDQHRVIEGPLFVHENVLWEPEGWRSGKEALKAISVRELEAWIDKQVRFDAAAPDPMLFPEAAVTLSLAREEAEKIVPITHDHYVPPAAKDGTRTYGPMSWKRADGTHRSKACDQAVTGVIVVGPGRGEAFKVCTDKKGCKTHWGAERRQAQKRATEVAKSGKTGEDRYAIQLRKAEEQREREKAERERWLKARPAILTALAAVVKKASARSNGLLATILLEHMGPSKHAATYVLRGTTAEDLVRHLAFGMLAGEVTEWEAPMEFPRRAKAFGIDVRKIVDEVAPAPKVEAQKKVVKDKPSKASPAKRRASASAQV